MESYKISNGGSLEDCYTNLFALTDLTGIRWRKLSAASHFHCVDPLDDPVLLTFSKCLKEDILCVWRRVIKNETSDFHRTIDVTSKELWVFWYGEEPLNMKRVLSQELIEAEQGGWDAGLSYECRTLLFKAMHNLIEKCLLSRNFVRLGRWFVQPYDNSGSNSDKSSHLSISFHFFLHGESTVCSSVDVREHAPVRLITSSHISIAQTTTTDVKVVLAPHGLSGVLTGQTFKSGDNQVLKLIEEWKQFYPLDAAFESMLQTDPELPLMIEVLVGGTRMKYPTCYVLISDMDYLDHRLVETRNGTHPNSLSSPMENHYPSYENGPVEIPVISDGPQDFDESGYVFDCLIDKSWQDQIIITGQKRSADIVSNEHSEYEVGCPAGEWYFNEPIQKVHCGCPRFRSKNRYNPSGRDKGIPGLKYSRFEKSDKFDYKMSKHSRVPFYRRSILPDHLGDEVDFIMVPQNVGPLHVFEGLNHINPRQFELNSPHSVTVSPSVDDVANLTTTDHPISTLTPGSEDKVECIIETTPESYSCEQSTVGNIKPSWMDVITVEPQELPPVSRPDLIDASAEDDSESCVVAKLYDFSSQDCWLQQPLKSCIQHQQHYTFYSDSDKEESPTVPCQDPYEFSDESSGTVTSIPFYSKDFESIESPVNVGSGIVNEKDLVPTYSDLERIFESDDDSNDCIKESTAIVGTLKMKLEESETDKSHYASSYLASQHGNSLASATCVPGAIGAQELSTMFPTPPSMEATTTSPGVHHVDHHSVELELYEEPEPQSDENDPLRHISPIMAIATLGNEKYSSIELPSHRLPPVTLMTTYKPSPLLLGTVPILNKSPIPVTQHRFINAMERGGTPGQMFDRLSVPMSPATGFHVNQRTPVNCDISSPASNSSSYINRNLSSIENIGTNSHTPEAYSLIVNISLSDTMLAVFKDHNFDMCNICVCNMSIKGTDVGLYVPETNTGESQYRCACGFSAIMNRKYSFQSGLFYEEEVEITQKRDDRFDYRKPPLTENRPGMDDGEEFGEQVLKLLRTQFCGLHVAMQLALPSHHKKMLWSQDAYRSPGSLTNRLEFEDGFRACESALEQGRQAMEHCSNMRSDDYRSRMCLHRWPHVQATLPKNTQDVVRLLKSIQPLLQDAIQKKRTTRLWEATYTITGPLTWKDFHKLAGRGSEEACEPQPIPSFLVGFDKEWLSVAPHSVRYWEKLSFEPYRKQRDVAYVIVAPDNELVLSRVRRYFMELSSSYQLCRLGRHGPINKVLRDGIMRVGKSQAKKLRDEDTLDEWFDYLGDSEMSDRIRLYGRVCKHILAPHLAELTVDKTLLVSPASVKSVNKSRASTPLSTSQPSPHTPPQEFQQVSSAASTPQSLTDERDGVSDGLDRLREATVTDTEPEEDDDLPTIVVYMIDPFTYGDDSEELTRLGVVALLRSFREMVQSLPVSMQDNTKLQIISLQDVMDSSNEETLDLQKFKSLAFSVYARSAHPLSYSIPGRTLTGFGTASSAEAFLKRKNDHAGLTELYNPPFILAARREKAILEPPSDIEKTDILFCVYCLSDDQRWLLAVCTDERGELLETCSINIDIPNRNRRKKASARKSGLKRLWDFLLSVVAMATHPRRLVISRMGRLGHGEIVGWAGLLTKRNLLNANRSLRETCGICGTSNSSGDGVCILSACLVAMEVQPTFRVMPDVVKVEESQSSNIPMTTPRDASCTHILVFPTSATAAANSSGQLQENQIDIASSLGADIGDDDPFFSSLKEDLNLDQDLNGIFNLADSPVPSPGSPGRPCSPIMSSRRNSPSQFVNTSNIDSSGTDPQDEPPNLLQQPLAMGYYVSTAKPGPMPRWLWTNRAHTENNCPTCFKFSLHIHSPSITQNQDELLHSSSNRSSHPLDSNFTCDVLRSVLEMYNRLSWLTMDMAGNDRASCLPHHFLVLMQLYHAMDTFV